MLMQVAEAAGEVELYRFSVADSNGNVYRLAAPTETARQAWLSALREAILAGSPSRHSSTGGTPAHSPHSGQLKASSFLLLVSSKALQPGLYLLEKPSLSRKASRIVADAERIIQRCFMDRRTSNAHNCLMAGSRHLGGMASLISKNH